MSTRDSNFLKYLGLTHGEVSTALGVSRPSITEGVNKSGNYFNRTKLSKLAEYLKAKEGYDATGIDEVRQRYLSDPAAFTDGPGLIGSNPRDWTFSQLWTFGKALEELHSEDFVNDLLASCQNDIDKTLVYAVPDQSLAEVLFRRFSRRLKDNLDCVNVYIFELAVSQFLPTMRIVDPQGESPKSYIRLFDGSLGRASEEAGSELMLLFKSKALGISGNDFYGESSPQIHGEVMRLLYDPDDIHRGSEQIVKVHG